MFAVSCKQWRSDRQIHYPNAISKKRGYRRYSIQSPSCEESVFYNIACIALQAFLILLKKKHYGTGAGENKCSLTMVLFPP